MIGVIKQAEFTGDHELFVYAQGCLVLETHFGRFFIHNEHSFFQVVEQLFNSLAWQLRVYELETNPANHTVETHGS